MDIVEIYKNACGNAWLVLLICFCLAALIIWGAYSLFRFFRKKNIFTKLFSESKLKIFYATLLVSLYIIGYRWGAISCGIVWLFSELAEWIMSKSNSKIVEIVCPLLCFATFVFAIIVTIADLLRKFSTIFCGVNII